MANPAKQITRIQLEEVLRHFTPDGRVLCFYHSARPNEVVDESVADFINDFRRNGGAYLTTGPELAWTFLEGAEIIIKLERRLSPYTRDEEEYRYKNNQPAIGGSQRRYFIPMMDGGLTTKYLEIHVDHLFSRHTSISPLSPNSVNWAYFRCKYHQPGAGCVIYFARELKNPQKVVVLGRVPKTEDEEEKKKPKKLELEVNHWKPRPVQDNWRKDHNEGI